MGTPEELPFPMILIHPLLHSLGLMKYGSVGPSGVTLCSRSGLVRDVSKSVRSKVSVPAGSLAKNPPANAGDSDSVPGSGRCPGAGNATHSSILSWETLWTEETARLQFMGSQKSQTRLSV